MDPWVFLYVCLFVCFVAVVFSACFYSGFIVTRTFMLLPDMSKLDRYLVATKHIKAHSVCISLRVYSIL